MHHDACLLTIGYYYLLPNCITIDGFSSKVVFANIVVFSNSFIMFCSAEVRLEGQVLRLELHHNLAVDYESGYSDVVEKS